ncbi:M48 family metalloprotease [Lapidilactobacillus gannanensis]|uniref:ImmA/IrrE family metallo-endopeptidase n=1 Tax=Lapidilactobacillus gannanensis TaxID=2486002 RepID=A0ABW4BML8_9LACO|nr:ImmA/IrrE family metallo-endopeptidase [Lapidilactobacillus gannanensis]
MDDLLNKLLNYAMEHGIGYCIESFSPEIPPLVDTERHLIILNSNWQNQKELSMQVAHEIGHVINGDVGTLHYSPCSDSSAEADANRYAIKLLVFMYFEDIDQEDTNEEQFMDDLAIPAWLKDESHKEILKFYE